MEKSVQLVPAYTKRNGLNVDYGRKRFELQSIPALRKLFRFLTLKITVLYIRKFIWEYY